MERPRSWLHPSALWLIVLGGCFPPLEQADLDVQDVDAQETSASDTATSGDTAEAPDSAGPDTAIADSSDATSDAGECDQPEDCPSVTGPCRARACVDHACEVVNVDGACDDGDLCTTNDRCAGGGCVATPVTCTPLNDCHDAGTCDAETGSCTSPARADGAVCDDEDPCTITDRCEAGTCEGAGSPNDNLGDWTRGFGGEGADEVRWLDRAPGGAIVVCGTFEGASLWLGSTPSGAAVSVEMPDGAAEAVFVARFDIDGRPLGAALVGASTIEIDCEGGLSVDSGGSVTVAGSWHGVFESGVAEPPDAPDSGFFVVRLGAELAGTWAVWGTPSPGAELGPFPITIDGNAAGQVIIATSGSSGVDVRGQTTQMTIGLTSEDYAALAAGAAIISPLGEVHQALNSSPPLDDDGTAFAITRVLALDSGGFIMAGGVIGDIDIGPLSVSGGAASSDFDPVVVFVDATLTPTEFARLPTGEGEDFVTTLDDEDGTIVVAVTGADSGEEVMSGGVEDLGGWEGAAVLGFAPGGLPLWLTGFFSAPDDLVVASVGHLPDSQMMYVLAAHRGTVVFGDAAPPYVVAPSDTSVTTLSLVMLESDGAVTGAERLTEPVAGLGGLSSLFVGLTADGVPTPDGYFIGGRFSGALPQVEATAGTCDAFVMRRNSQGGLFCD